MNPQESRGWGVQKVQFRPRQAAMMHPLEAPEAEVIQQQVLPQEATLRLPQAAEGATPHRAWQHVETTNLAGQRQARPIHGRALHEEEIHRRVQRDGQPIQHQGPRHHVAKLHPPQPQQKPGNDH